MTDLTKPGKIAKPVITSIYTADPSAVVGQDGRLYIYASHDMDPARGCDFMDRYHIFSTDDMVHFLDEGEILRSDDVEWGRPEGGFMWAPDCAFKNGKYWFYYPHPTSSRWNDTWEFGVAVSDYTGSTVRQWIKKRKLCAVTVQGRSLAAKEWLAEFMAGYEPRIWRKCKVHGRMLNMISRNQ